MPRATSAGKQQITDCDRFTKVARVDVTMAAIKHNFTNSELFFTFCIRAQTVKFDQFGSEN